MPWVKRAWKGFVETYLDCPALVISVTIFAIAAAGLSVWLPSWELAGVALVLAVIETVVGYTHPLATMDDGRYGADGL